MFLVFYIAGMEGDPIHPVFAFGKDICAEDCKRLSRGLLRKGVVFQGTGERFCMACFPQVSLLTVLF